METARLYRIAGFAILHARASARKWIQKKLTILFKASAFISASNIVVSILQYFKIMISVYQTQETLCL